MQNEIRQIRKVANTVGAVAGIAALICSLLLWLIG